MTAEEFAALPPDWHGELVRGELVEMPPPGARHGEIANEVAFRLMQHVRAHRLGKILTNDAGFILERGPDTVRGPDVSFIRADRVPASGLPKGYFPGAPDVAIEVISPHDKMTDVNAKVELFIEAGCPMVVLLDPELRTATIHRPNLDPHIVRGEEPLDLSAVVDGFGCALADIFG